MNRGARKLLGVGAILGLVAVGVFAPLTLAGTTGQASVHRTYATCPSSDRSPLTSSTPGATTALVPGHARQVLLCRYSGLNPDPSTAGRLLAHRLVTAGQTVSQLAQRLDALRRFGRGAYSCPADFGVKIIAFFRYRPATEPDDPVTVDPNGCTPVTNGRITRTAMFAPGTALIAELEREVG
jgi:hypothetical protein